MLNKRQLLLLLISILAIDIGAIIYTGNCVIKHIEKHSVHPQYGLKNVSFAATCFPWDDCGG